MYGSDYVHRQCYITNMWFLAGLSRDCDKTTPNTDKHSYHEHVLIAPQHGTGLSTKSVQAFNVNWCANYATLVAKFVQAPDTSRCLVCMAEPRWAQAHGTEKVIGEAKNV